MYSGTKAPLVIAHRGLHDDLPENSLPAFRKAVEAGADGIELDVHAAADDTLYVHHDGVVDVDGSPVPFRSLEPARLGRITQNGDLPIPTLDDALEAIGDGCLVFIEIKAKGIEPSVERCLRRHVSRADRYAVHAFDHRVAKRMLELIPSVTTGILQGSYLIDSCAELRRTGATDLWQHVDMVDADLVTDVHACGGRVIGWTANVESQWESLAAAGVDGICTDRVDACIAWRARHFSQ